MKLSVTYPDIEELVHAYLTTALAGAGEECTVLIGVPSEWTPAAGDLVQVALDGTPLAQWPMVQHGTCRLTGWAATPREAKRIAQIAQGLLLAAGPGHGFAATRFLTGLFPGRDPQTHAEIASNTTRVSVRSTPIEPSGS